MHIYKKKCEENKIYRYKDWYTRETDYTSYLPDNAFTIEYNYGWFRHMQTCTSQQLSLLTKNLVRQRYVDIVVNMYLWMIYNHVQSFRKLLNNVWPS